jgi:hypothetical protein
MDDHPPTTCPSSGPSTSTTSPEVPVPGRRRESPLAAGPAVSRDRRPPSCPGDRHAGRSAIGPGPRDGLGADAAAAGPGPAAGPAARPASTRPGGWASPAAGPPRPDALDHG